jgi:hypothetical protein
MEIIRYPSAVDQMMQRRYRVGGWIAVFAFGLLYGGYAVGGVAGLVMMAFGLMALAHGAFPIIYRAWDARLGARGELRVDEVLADLDDQYKLLCNYCPPGEVGDADRLLVGPNGVLLIEVKTYSTAVRVRGADWWVKGQSGRWRKIKSPARQAQRCAKALAGEFGKVDCVIVVRDRMSLDTEGSPVPIVRFRDLAEFIRERDSLPKAA